MRSLRGEAARGTYGEPWGVQGSIGESQVTYPRGPPSLKNSFIYGLLQPHPDVINIPHHRESNKRRIYCLDPPQVFGNQCTGASKNWGGGLFGSFVKLEHNMLDCIGVHFGLPCFWKLPYTMDYIPHTMYSISFPWLLETPAL